MKYEIFLPLWRAQCWLRIKKKNKINEKGFLEKTQKNRKIRRKNKKDNIPQDEKRR